MEFDQRDAGGARHQVDRERREPAGGQRQSGGHRQRSAGPVEGPGTGVGHAEAVRRQHSQRKAERQHGDAHVKGKVSSPHGFDRSSAGRRPGSPAGGIRGPPTGGGQDPPRVRFGRAPRAPSVAARHNPHLEEVAQRCPHLPVPMPARAASRFERLASWSQRRRWWAVALWVIALAAVTVASQAAGQRLPQRLLASRD